MFPGVVWLLREKCWHVKIKEVSKTFLHSRTYEMRSRTGPRQGFECESKPIVEDICTTMGLVNAVRLILRLKPKSLLALGLPCNSFGYMSSSLHCRSNELPHGREHYPFVCLGNQIGYRSELLTLLGVVRMVLWFLENPERSKCVVLPVLERISSANVLRSRTCKWSDAYKSVLVCVCV